MRILFLGDVVGIAGCSKIMNNLLDQVKINKIDFVIVNGENADRTGVGLTKYIGNCMAEHMPFKIPYDWPKLNILVTPCPGIAETCSIITLMSFLSTCLIFFEISL